MRKRHRKAIANAIALLEHDAQMTFDSNTNGDGKFEEIGSRKDYRRYKRAAKRLREITP